MTLAAEMALDGVLPALMAGTAPHRPQDLATGSYFSGRKPEDGRIDWRSSAAQVHNLVRAVAPPYPGAFCDLAGHHLRVLATTLADGLEPGSPELMVQNGVLVARCGDGRAVKILALELDGVALAPATLPGHLGGSTISLV